ncbi:MAG: CopG family transcriptional regulator [Gammaproteobacteria bacterium]|nr:MAG: CopG family transcriptional regulator [Gammaproteobacteria bacterium]
MRYDWLLLPTKPMKISAKYKAISVTVPAEMEEALAEVCRKEIRKKSEVVTEALRLYFRARGGKPHVWSLVMPTGEQERAQIDYGAFADEWGSEHDAVYDKLGK